MSIFICRPGSALQNVCNMTKTATRSTINWKTGHVSPTPASLSLVLDSLCLTARSQETARWFPPLPVQEAALRHSKRHGQTTFSRLPVPANLCHHISIYLKQLLPNMESPCLASDRSSKFSTRKHIVPWHYDSRDWNTLPPFKTRNSHHSLAAVLTHLKCRIT